MCRESLHFQAQEIHIDLQACELRHVLLLGTFIALTYLATLNTADNGWCESF